MANTVSEIMKCYLLRSQPSIFSGNQWEFAVAHSPFLILAYLSMCLRRVRFGQWILSIDSPIPTAFMYCSNYMPEDSLTPALLQIRISMQFDFCQENVLVQDLGGEKEERPFFSNSNRCQCLRWLDSLFQGLVTAT